MLTGIARWFRSNKVAVFLITSSLIVGGLYYKQVSCQADYNAAFTESLSLRSEASNARLDALDDLMTGISVFILHPNPDATPEEKAEAGKAFGVLFTEYIDAVNKNAEVREAHPLPAIPDC